MIEQGTAFTITLDKGNLDGIIQITSISWRGCAFRIFRDKLSEYKNAPELKCCGIYFLFGRYIDNEGILHRHLYIGQAAVRKNGDAIIKRIQEHNTTKENYWTEAIALTANESTIFGKTEISYLESSFTKLAQEAKKNVPNYIIENSNDPNIGSINKEQKWMLNAYIEEVKLLFKCFQYDFFDHEETIIINNNQERKSTNTYIETVPYKVGIIVNCAFRQAILDNYITEEDIDKLLSQNSAHFFKLNSSIPFLTADTPISKNGKTRYYSKPVNLNGKKYYITSELLARTKNIIINYLIEHGMNINEINTACSKYQNDKSALKHSKITNAISQLSVNIDAKPKCSSIEISNAFPFKVGKVIRYAFSYALKHGFFNSHEIDFLLSKDSAKVFKTRGYPVLIMEEKLKTDKHGINRYGNQAIECNGKQLWITTQVYKEGLSVILSYLNQHGMTNEFIIELCNNELSK